ncbi:hypothetical protein NDU88_005140 [Pleurodeles waltl]|uniref:Uncharacterized protein n=1 Tax=Pleurodeles waltl TaxID=8319 RepID=A0AAV7W792_PLEWA|nr:hypothetical protein NDU88_005140 [Pleurodeles waltl]
MPGCNGHLCPLSLFDGSGTHSRVPAPCTVPCSVLPERCQSAAILLGGRSPQIGRLCDAGPYQTPATQPGKVARCSASPTVPIITATQISEPGPRENRLDSRHTPLTALTRRYCGRPPVEGLPGEKTKPSGTDWPGRGSEATTRFTRIRDRQSARAVITPKGVPGSSQPCR